MSKRLGSRVVSVIVPVRNVRSGIETFCQVVLNQILPEGWALELVVADGRSTDGTREFLQRLSLRESRLRWVDSPRRLEASCLNAALRGAVGDVIVRMDARTDYSADYIHQALRVLGESGADKVGGAWRVRASDPTNSMQGAMALVSQAMSGPGQDSSGADYNGWVSHVLSCCWPRSTFERFGGFDDRLARLHDQEHNLRVARGGGLIWQSSRLRSVRCLEGDLSDFFNEHLRIGYWHPLVMKKYGRLPSLLSLRSVWILALLILALPSAMLFRAWWPMLGAGLATLLLLMWDVRNVWREHSSASGVGVLVRLPFAVAAFHLGRGLGSLMGAWALLRRHRVRFRMAPQPR